MGGSLSKPSDPTNDVATLYVWDRHRARAVRKTKKPVGERDSKGSNNEEVEEVEVVELVELVDLDGDVDNSGDSALLSLFFWSAIIVGTKTLAELAVINYWGYLSAQHTLKVSEGVIKELLAVSNHLRNAEWKDDLAEWQEKRDSAAAFMDKHKFSGKLVKWFRPSPPE